VLARTRQWDMVSAARVDRLVANSRLVRWRIRHYWHREAEVIPPPVDTEFFTPGGEREDRLLTVATLVPYKRVEVAIDVARILGKKLDIIGMGPQRARLERHAGEQVRFLGWVPREELRNAYRRASMLLVPNIEDFGMVTVEALACGTPVVGLKASGAADVVRSGREGALANDGSAQTLADAAAEVLEQDWSVEQLRARAEVFSRQQFLVRFKFLLDRLGFKVGPL